MSLKWGAVLLLCSVCWAHGLDDRKSDPLVIITFPLDNESESTVGHTLVIYILYPWGYATNEKYVYGKPSVDSNSAWLNQSHVDAVLKLVAKIASSSIKPRSPVDTIFIKGTTTDNKMVSRDYHQNITDIRSLLRLLGGVRGDLEEHLSETRNDAPTGRQDPKGD